MTVIRLRSTENNPSPTLKSSFEERKTYFSNIERLKRAEAAHRIQARKKRILLHQEESILERKRIKAKVTRSSSASSWSPRVGVGGNNSVASKSPAPSSLTADGSGATKSKDFAVAIIVARAVAKWRMRHKGKVDSPKLSPSPSLSRSEGSRSGRTEERGECKPIHGLGLGPGLRDDEFLSPGYSPRSRTRSRSRASESHSLPSPENSVIPCRRHL